MVEYTVDPLPLPTHLVSDDGNSLCVHRVSLYLLPLRERNQGGGGGWVMLRKLLVFYVQDTFTPSTSCCGSGAFTLLQNKSAT